MEGGERGLRRVAFQVERAGRFLTGEPVFCHLKSVALSRPLLKDRRLFRQEILNWLTTLPVRLPPLSPVQKKNLLSPGQYVIFEEGGGMSFSLSHCPYFMACVFRHGRSKVSLGFDLEKPDRLKNPSRLLQRVASEEEISQAPHPVALWSAKEAAFKTLRAKTPPPPSLKKLSIFNWQKENSQTFRYEFTPPAPPKGGELLSPRRFSSAEASFTKSPGTLPAPVAFKGPGRGVVLFFDFVLVSLAGLWF